MTTVSCEIWNDAPELALPEDPAILYDSGDVWLGYEIAPGEGRYAVIRFRQVLEYQITPINDEGLGKHPYAKAGLKWYSFNELLNSAETLKYTVVSSKDSRPLFIARHWVVTFKERTVDIVSRGDADPVSAMRRRRCHASQLATVVAADIGAASPMDAILRVLEDPVAEQLTNPVVAPATPQTGNNDWLPHPLLSGKHLLVVHYLSSIRYFLRRALLRLGAAEVSMAETGQDALDLLRSGNVDLVMTGVKMAEMDGFDLQKTLSSDPTLSNIAFTKLIISSDPIELVNAVKADGTMTWGPLFDRKSLEEKVDEAFG